MARTHNYRSSSSVNEAEGAAACRATAKQTEQSDAWHVLCCWGTSSQWSWRTQRLVAACGNAGILSSQWEVWCAWCTPCGTHWPPARRTAATRLPVPAAFGIGTWWLSSSLLLLHARVFLRLLMLCPLFAARNICVTPVVSALLRFAVACFLYSSSLTISPFAFTF
jgi:hypothetical protein